MLSSGRKVTSNAAPQVQSAAGEQAATGRGVQSTAARKIQSSSRAIGGFPFSVEDAAALVEESESEPESPITVDHSTASGRGDAMDVDSPSTELYVSAASSQASFIVIRAFF